MPTYIVTTSDGQRHRVTTRGEASQSELQAAVRSQKSAPDNSRARGVLGGLLKPIDDLATWASALPGMDAVDRLGQAIGLDSVKQATAKNDRLRRSNTRTGYQAIGGIIGTLPALALPGGVVAQGAAGGALLSDDPTSLRGVVTDAVLGGAAGKAGEQLGKRVIAPVAERVGRTEGARALAAAATRAAERLSGKPKKMLPNPRFNASERAVNRTAPAMDEVRRNVQDAADLGLPYALADASPQLRTLAGSVARKSPDARALAEQNFHPRALGQADRAVNAIDEHLAPITNIEQRAGDIRRAAQDASEPFYTQARGMPAPVDEEITAALRAPAGKQALQDAYTIAANEGRDPNAMGLFMDEGGTVWMGETPTFETLQLVKRGLDAQLAPFRNQITGKLDLEGRPDAQAINGLLKRFNTRLGEVNEPYRLGNDAYSNVIRRRDALHLGQDISANNVPQRTFDAALSRADEVTLPEVQRGYATSMADIANRQRFSANPYNSVYGSPLQQQKVGALFPEGAEKFGRQYDLEGQMAATRTETLGGSPTQARNMADQLFDAGADSAGAVFDVAHAPVSGALRLGARAVQDRLRTGGERKAAEIAPTLFDTSNPNLVLGYLDDLAKKNAEAQYRREVYQKLGGLLGLPAAATVNSN